MIDLVNMVAALTFVTEDAGLDEDAQMARCRRPRVREAAGDVACRHRAAQMHGEQDLPPRRMSDRRAHGFERVELGFRVQCQVVTSIGSSMMIVSSAR